MANVVENNEVVEKAEVAPVAETVETGIAEQPAMGGISLLRDKLTELYPEREFASDDDVAQFAARAIEQLANGQKRFMELLDGSPQIAEVLKLMADGASPMRAMGSTFTPDEYSELVNNAPEGDELRIAIEGRKKKLADIESMSKALEEALANSQAEIAAFIQEEGISEEEAMSLLSAIEEIQTALNDGKITRNELRMFRKMINFDDAVAEAEEVGNIAGRNEVIGAHMQGKKDIGSGIPAIAGAVVKDAPPVETVETPSWLENRSVARRS